MSAKGKAKTAETVASLRKFGTRLRFCSELASFRAQTAEQILPTGGPLILISKLSLRYANARGFYNCFKILNLTTTKPSLGEFGLIWRWRRTIPTFAGICPAVWARRGEFRTKVKDESQIIQIWQQSRQFWLYLLLTKGNKKILI